MHVNISWASFQWNELSYPQEISQEGQKVLVIILSKTSYLHQWSCAECKTPAPTSYPTPRKVRTINCEKIPSSLLMQMVIVIASLFYMHSPYQWGYRRQTLQGYMQREFLKRLWKTWWRQLCQLQSGMRNFYRWIWHIVMYFVKVLYVRMTHCIALWCTMFSAILCCINFFCD